MTKQIPLSQDKFALVDDADFDWLSQWKWHCTVKGYAARNINSGHRHGRKILLMHREINKTHPGIKTDHRDGNGLNNQRYNLRNSTDSQNMMNRKSARGSSSRFKGVYWNKQDRKWRVQITANKKRIYLGDFKSDTDAAIAYNKKAVELHGEFALLNRVDS